MKKLRLIPALLVLACGEPIAPPPSFAHDAATADLEVLFGPVTLTRTTGAPNTLTETVSTAGFEAPFVLVATSTSGAVWVELDGETVVQPGDVQSGGAVSVPVDGLTDGATLALRIAGRPGATLTVSIEGRPAAITFCPTAVGGFDDLQEAVDATPEGGTVFICDGTFDLGDVTVPHAMTVTAEHPGQATLNTRGRGFLTEDVTTGAFTVRDLQFTGVGSVVSAFGNWSAVVAVRNAFDMAGPSISLFLSGGLPGAVATIQDNVFHGGLTSAFVVSSGDPNAGPHGIVERNAMSGQTFSNLQIQGGASAFIANNTLEACGPVACIQAPTGGAVTVRDNVFRTDAAHVTRAAIRYTDRSFAVAASLTASGNVIEGVVPADPNTAADYGFQSAAIEVTLVNPTSLMSLTDNTVRHAWAGVLFRAPASGPATALNNVIDGVGIGLHLTLDVFVPLIMQRNDITNALTDILSDGGVAPLPGSLTCNWWGSADEPPVVVGVAVPGVYTPFAVQPIANNPGVVCP